MFLVTDSKNSKIGLAAATYAPIAQTCPDTCPLKANGCYAQGGNVGMHVRRLERATDGLNGDTAAMLEAAQIKDAKIRDDRPLRIHVSGDAITDFRARTISEAARSWRGKVWSYTHAWREVARSSWNNVSVLASCESLPQAKCTDCRLCFDDKALLARNAVIAFAAHGHATKRALTVVQ